MSPADWIIPLKVGVTVAFFGVFSALVAFTYARPHREALEAHRDLPLRDGAPGLPVPSHTTATRAHPPGPRQTPPLESPDAPVEEAHHA